VKVKVVEIYDTIIGEGRYMGALATFLRLGGCNLRCSWCDTKYAWNEYIEVDLDTLLYVLGNKLPRTKRLVITGGEPLLQKDAVLAITERYWDRYDVFIETNGTITLDVDEADMFWLITVSPKRGKIGVEQLREWKKIGDETGNVDFKFVVGDWTVEEVNAMVKACGIESGDVWLMPLTKNGKVVDEYARQAWEACVRYGYNYSDRLHIRVWGDKRMR